MAEHDDDWFRKYLDAGAALGQITRARAEAFVKELMGGHDQSGDTKQRVEEFIERGRRATEELLTLVRTEVASQLSSLGLDAEQLGNQLAEVLRRTAGAQRRASKSGDAPPPIQLGSGTWTAGEPTPATAGEPAPATVDEPGAGADTAPPEPAKKAAGARKAPAKKAATTAAAPAKKAPAKKAAAKETAEKAPAKRAAPAKKAAAKEATAGEAAPSAGGPDA